MYTGKLWCRKCDKITDFEFTCQEDMPTVCPNCNSDDVFYNELDFGDDYDDTPIKTGDGGCGGYRRHPNITDTIN